MNANPAYGEMFEVVNGGPPFGKGLFLWMEESPGFRLDRVHIPLRLLANEPDSLFAEWEWFSGLSRLAKPVEMVYLPEAEHVRYTCLSDHPKAF